MVEDLDPCPPPEPSGMRQSGCLGLEGGSGGGGSPRFAPSGNSSAHSPPSSSERITRERAAWILQQRPEAPLQGCRSHGGDLTLLPHKGERKGERRGRRGGDEVAAGSTHLPRTRICSSASSSSTSTPPHPPPLSSPASASPFSSSPRCASALHLTAPRRTAPSLSASPRARHLIMRPPQLCWRPAAGISPLRCREEKGAVELLLHILRLHTGVEADGESQPWRSAREERKRGGRGRVGRASATVGQEKDIIRKEKS
jgi:hypothetical protein